MQQLKNPREKRAKEKRRTNLGGKVLEDGGKVDWSTGADALCILAGLEEASDTADGELEPSLAAP